MPVIIDLTGDSDSEDPSHATTSSSSSPQSEHHNNLDEQEEIPTVDQVQAMIAANPSLKDLHKLILTAVASIPRGRFATVTQLWEWTQDHRTSMIAKQSIRVALRFEGLPLSWLPRHRVVEWGSEAYLNGFGEHMWQWSDDEWRDVLVAEGCRTGRNGQLLGRAFGGNEMPCVKTWEDRPGRCTMHGL